MDKRFILSVAVLMLLSVSIVQATTPTSMKVDFDETTTELSLSSGQSGVLTMVVENSGGQDAEDVSVRIYAANPLSISKTFKLGSIAAGDSKTLPIIVSVYNTPQTGLATVHVYITYDGYDSSGDPETDETVHWEIPVRITGDPMFQITPQNTSFFDGAVSDFTLDIMSINPANDIQATLSSDCLVVMGSSKKYVGDLYADQKTTVNFEIKPTEVGSCQTTLELEYRDEFGTDSTETIPIGINIGDSKVDVRVDKVEYGEIGPGDLATIKLTLTNEGSVTAEDSVIEFSLSDPFVPVSGSEKTVGDILPGQTVEVEFEVYISWDAETATYSLPINIEYDNSGSTYSDEKEIGIDVSGRVILEIIEVSSESSSVRIQLANIGTRAAESLTATLVTGGSREMPEGMELPEGMEMPEGTISSGQSSELVEYKSSVKSTKESTLTFDTSYTGEATLILEYTGLNNQRVTQEEQITIGSGSSSVMGTSGTMAGMPGGRGGGSDNTIYYVLGAVVVLLLLRYHHLKKKGQIESKGWKNLYGVLSAKKTEKPEPKHLKNLYGLI